MNKDEVDGVLAHEVSHIANGDMVTLTLIQGVLNVFVIFFARVIGHFVDRVILKNERGLGIGYFVVSILAQIVLGILASTVVMWFSRQREFRADAARRVSPEPIAWWPPSSVSVGRRTSRFRPDWNAFGISGGVRVGSRCSSPRIRPSMSALLASGPWAG